MATPLNIAVMLNGKQTSSPKSAAIRASFTIALTSASFQISHPTPPSITFYDPIVAQIYPDPARYDLIVLSGGTADPMGSEPWVLKLQDYLRETVQNFPRQKIVGICWGHQTICVSFGGRVEGMLAAEVGVTPLTLTAEGRKMFPLAAGNGTVWLHEFHGREIRVPANGFVPLMEGSQAFRSGDNNILTLQGHPELNEELATMLVRGSPAYMGVEESEKESYIQRAAAEHDGVSIWARILEWTRE